MNEKNEMVDCSCGQKVPKSIVDEVIARRIATAKCFCGVELEAGLCPNGHDPVKPASSDDWLPIETAPRDGTAILVGRKRNTAQAVRWMISDTKDAPSGAWFVGGYDGHRLRWEPTHWTTLPALDAAANSVENNEEPNET